MEDDWIEWEGGSQPVSGSVQLKFRDGEIHEGKAGNFGWKHYADYAQADIVAYRTVGAEVDEEPTPTISDGGSSDYYKLTIKNKSGEEFSCEMGDIIRHVFGNDFDLGNVVKAARRMYLASLGTGKEGTSIEYDAKKIEYFTREFVFWNEVP